MQTVSGISRGVSCATKKTIKPMDCRLKNSKRIERIISLRLGKCSISLASSVVAIRTVNKSSEKVKKFQ